MIVVTGELRKHIIVGILHTFSLHISIVTVYQDCYD